MQLFIRSCTIDHQILTITDAETIGQMIRVLRMKKGDQCVIQDQGIRYEVSLINIHKKEITAQIYNITHQAPQKSYTHIPLTVIIGIPNKLSKIELIAQKLTEIGIHHICLVAMKRSVVQEFSTHKLQRLQHIILEAAEQSWSRHIPSILIYPRGEMLTHYHPSQTCYGHIQPDNMHNTHIQTYMGYRNYIVGPEGGFDPQELQALDQAGYQIHHMPTHILRTETAAICAGYQLCLWNHKL